MRLARQVRCHRVGEKMAICSSGRDGAKSATGKPPPVIITRKDGDSHRFTRRSRAYTGVIASWLHTGTAKKSTTVKRKRRTKRSRAGSEAGRLPVGRMKRAGTLIALMPTGATPNGQRKCSGNACNAALHHSRYNWRKGGADLYRNACEGPVVLNSR